jgi:hypothetical protein
MSETFTELKAALSSAIRDPSNKSFTDASVGEMLNSSLVEVARYSPAQFYEGITLSTVTPLEYVLRSTEFAGVAQNEIEVSRVELWETVVGEPPRKLATVPPASRAWDKNSDSGWVNWGGILYLPRSLWNAFDGNESVYYLRVWGYSPFPALVEGTDTAALSSEQRAAVLAYGRVEALERLNADRELFTQWQTRAGNSDISPAGLMNMLSVAREDWRRRSRSLMRLRSVV